MDIILTGLPAFGFAEYTALDATLTGLPAFVFAEYTALDATLTGLPAFLTGYPALVLIILENFV